MQWGDPKLGGGCSQGAILCLFTLGGARQVQRDVSTGLVPKGLLSLGGTLGGAKANPFQVSPP